jgi:flagellar assembly protein FliH
MSSSCEQRRVQPIRGDTIAWSPASSLGVELHPEVFRSTVPEALLNEVRAEGYEAGLAAGRAEADDWHFAEATRLRAAAETLEAAARALQDRVILDAGRMADSAARAAFDLAEAVVGRELEHTACPGADALARGLANVVAPAEVVARLNPDDVAALAKVEPPSGIQVEIVADPAVTRGDCVVDLPVGWVDATIAGAFARARAALLGEDAS